jgi:hypothetical protein
MLVPPTLPFKVACDSKRLVSAGSTGLISVLYLNYWFDWPVITRVNINMKFENNIWKASIIIVLLYFPNGFNLLVNNSPELPKIELSLSSNKILGTPNALRIFELNFLLLIEIMYHQYYQCFFCIKMCSNVIRF